MKLSFVANVVFATMAISAAAFAQTPASITGPQTVSAQGTMMTAEQMMSQCERMMRDMRSDPVLMKHMNNIMLKQMMHGMMKDGSMMNGGTMNGADR